MNNELKRLNLELSAHCGYACAGCPNTYMGRKKGHMDLDLFKSIYNEIDEKIGKVFLWNYGESMLNPHIEEIINYTLDKKPRTILSTTGMNLYKFNDLSFLSNLDELIISINGFDQRAYEFHQKKGNLKKVLTGLEQLKSIMNSSKTAYILQTVVNSSNIEQLIQSEIFAKEYGFNKVIFKSFNVMDNKIETKNKYVPAKTSFKRGFHIDLHKEYPCNNWMVINWNGDVNLCCWDYEGKIVVGNVKKQGVFGTWQSQKMKNLKDRLNNEKIIEYCGKCLQKTTISEKVIL